MLTGKAVTLQDHMAIALVRAITGNPDKYHPLVVTIARVYERSGWPIGGEAFFEKIRPYAEDLPALEEQ